MSRSSSQVPSTLIPLSWFHVSHVHDMTFPEHTSTSNTPFIIGPTHNFDGFHTISRCYPLLLCCPPGLFLSRRHNCIPNARTSTPSHVYSPLFSRYCTTILSALQLYIMTCRRLRLTLALQHLLHHNISHSSLHSFMSTSFTCIKKSKKKKYMTRRAVRVSAPRRAWVSHPLNRSLTHTCA